MWVLKVLNKNAGSKYVGGRYPWKIGKKRKLDPEKGILLCIRGYHFVEPGHLDTWLDKGDRVFLARVDGRIVHGKNKGAASEMTLIEEVTYLFKDVTRGWAFTRTQVEKDFINVVGNAVLDVASGRGRFGNE